MSLEWNFYKLEDLINLRTGKLDSNAEESNGDYPFFTCAPNPLRINSFSFNQRAILLAGNNANGNFHINMAGRIKLNNVSYGTEMPSIENAKEGQIYFRIID